jgi:hypothetical protein
MSTTILEFLADGPTAPEAMLRPAMAHAQPLPSPTPQAVPVTTVLGAMDNSRAFAPLPGEQRPCRSCRGGRGDVNVNVNVNAGNTNAGTTTTTTNTSPLTPVMPSGSPAGAGSFPGTQAPGAERPQFESPATKVEYRPFAVPVDRVVKTVEYKPWAAVWDRIKTRFQDRPVAIPVDRVRQVPVLQPKPSFEGRRS